MNRREFLGWVGVGGIVSSLPVAIAACTPQGNRSADGFEAAGSVQELDQKGRILNQQLFGSSVLIVRNSINPSAIVAVKPICTHAGCTVDWKTDQTAFVCPCHDSRFAIDGKAIRGPASQPLTTYETKLEGDRILVKKA